MTLFSLEGCCRNMILFAFGNVNPASIAKAFERFSAWIGCNGTQARQ
ncbi:hypothetical protein [Sphingomonas gei]|nr:hypothetical protein [Sphingomonas gei]